MHRAAPAAHRAAAASGGLANDISSRYTFADLKASFDREHVLRWQLAMEAPGIVASMNSAVMSPPCLAACWRAMSIWSVMDRAS